MVKIGKHVFRGTWGDIVGSEVALERTDDSLSPHTVCHKRLHLEHVLLSRKV
jgi:hypothetical protein